MSEVTQQIKIEYNNLVKNVEQLRTDINYLDDYINKINETTEVIEPIETIRENIQDITKPEGQQLQEKLEQREQIIEETKEILEDKKEDLLEVLTEDADKKVKTNEEILEEKKEEMNDRKTNIENMLIKMAQDVKNSSINQDKKEAWYLLNETNKKLEQYLSTTLFYDIKRDWVTYGQQLWFRPDYYLKEYSQSYHELNINLGRNEYFKNIMKKYLSKDNNNPIHLEDLRFISIKKQIDDAYNGIIQLQKKGGRKTRKQKKHRKQRKSKKQRKSYRKK